MDLTGTRDAALERAKRFLSSGVSRYGKLRNFDFGPGDRSNVSLLSPYIRHRLLLDEESLAMTLASHSHAKVSKFVEEVFWRSYFKGWLQHHPSVWTDYRRKSAELIDTLERNSELRERYNTAIDGNTGIDCFDAWARELVETGYLHNHARMWFASIWVFTLDLPWQLGADFFLRHLMDGDPASNTLSWRWVSGLHTKGKTYLARVSNIVNYTDGRFNPGGRLATSAPPRQESVSHPTEALEFSGDRLPDARCGLLITEDDASAETLFEALKPAAVVGAVCIRRRSDLPVGTVAHRFATEALKDALTRSGSAFEAPTEYFEADDWAESLADWATRHHLQTIVTAAPPVGPVRDVLDAAAHGLSRYGIEIRTFNREFDRAVWPHADRGYFKLKKKIPALIERLDSDAALAAFAGQAGLERPSQLSLLSSSG